MDYKAEKEKIIAEFGKPEYDGMRGPVNESARRLKALSDQNLKGHRQLSSARKYDAIVAQSYSPIDITDVDLQGFDKLEKEIIKAYFENRGQSARQLGDRFNVPFQQVGALFRDKRFKYLKQKYLSQLLEENVMSSLLDNTAKGDPRTTLELLDRLEAFNKKDNPELNQVKRIEDVKLERALMLLGNWYSSSEDEITIKRTDL